MRFQLERRRRAWLRTNPGCNIVHQRCEIPRLKPQIAITQRREARQSGAPNTVVLADAGYGNDAAFRASVGELGLHYAVGIQSSTRVWPPGLAPLPAVPSTGKLGRPRSLQRRVPGYDPVAVKDLALALDPSCYHTVSWREGNRAALSSRFAALRVWTSHRDNWRATPRDEEWLLIEWSLGGIEPTKYWLSTLPEETVVQHLVHVAKMRWRIKRDCQDLKQEFGLGHLRDVGGVVLIITHLYALPPLDFSSHSA
ncbi:hypothetical protein AWB64_02578 [Caballeronia sordidicola]|uniref:Transposase IS701-like DDE domain-containing protein n=1 Tax=Caballeronia sordidicola TaxID=196367 RepID=A0A158GCJ0_CABSO|nr:hypothetical protein AWB64_02578 [Caballeronia sordidicola]